MRSMMWYTRVILLESCRHSTGLEYNRRTKRSQVYGLWHGTCIYTYPPPLGPHLAYSNPYAKTGV